MDLNKAEQALQAFGMKVWIQGEGLRFDLGSDDGEATWWGYGRFDKESDVALVETSVRACVLSVAPGSYASPVEVAGDFTEAVRVVLRPFRPHAAAHVFEYSYAGAWIQAAVALHEKGLAAPYYEVKKG